MENAWRDGDVSAEHAEHRAPESASKIEFMREDAAVKLC